MKKKLMLIMVFVMMLGVFSLNYVKAAYLVDSSELPIKTIINLADDDGEEKLDIVLEDENFTYMLTPLTEETPLPSNGTVENGVWKITVKGDYGDYSIAPITFVRPGIYEYKFEQIPGTNEDIQYDNMVYKLIYDVSNNDTYDSLVCKIIITDEDENYKYEDIKYTNLYNAPEIPVEPEPKDDPIPQPEQEKIDTSDINVLFYVAIFAGTAFVIARKIKNIED